MLKSRIKRQKAFAVSVYVLNLLIIVGFWAAFSGSAIFESASQSLIALGRLAGLLGAYFALTQLVLMSRGHWLESAFGLDKIARFHRVQGFMAISFILIHPPLLAIGYAIPADIKLPEQFLQFIQFYPYVWLAAIGLVLFVTVVGSSIYISRKHLKFETWYGVHLLAYLAIASVFLHQLALGNTLLTSRFFYLYWVGLYIFVAATVLKRFAHPLYLYLRHGFRVKSVKTETPFATSIIIEGKNIDQQWAKPGQFIMVRFLAPGMWWQEHPFSLSQLPANGILRITAKKIGDYTRDQLPVLKAGTKAIVDGPFGAFTEDVATLQKRLYIAGGVGITPIRSLIEGQSDKTDSILLYANKVTQEIIFNQELTILQQAGKVTVHHVISDQPEYKGETGRINAEMIKRLVPDYPEREIYLCGPPPMMQAMIATLTDMGIPKTRIHYEYFALHISPKT